MWTNCCSPPLNCWTEPQNRQISSGKPTKNGWTRNLSTTTQHVYITFWPIDTKPKRIAETFAVRSGLRSAVAPAALSVCRRSSTFFSRFFAPLSFSLFISPSCGCDAVCLGLIGLRMHEIVIGWTRAHTHTYHLSPFRTSFLLDGRALIRFSRFSPDTQNGRIEEKTQTEWRKKIKEIEVE